MFRILISKYILRFQSCFNSTDLHISKEIKVPNKIYRNDLSVLKALASCVKIESGPPQYSCIDDPFLFPRDYTTRKKFLLSKASGKLNARIAFNDIKHSFIKVARDEPKVKCLLPLMAPGDIICKVEAGELTVEKGLYLIINLLKRKEAWKFYEDNKSGNFSPSVLQNLLELLCATGVEEDCESMFEETFFIEKNLHKWTLDNEAEIFFQILPNKTKESYETIICGASKFDNPHRALELYREMRKNFPNEFPRIQTCNSFLRSLRTIDITEIELRKLIMEILTEMKKFNIRPNVLTFNNAIYAFSNRSEMKFVEGLYEEMLSIGIEPILGTYSVILECNFNQSYRINLVMDIILNLENRMKTIDYEDIQSQDDLNLFVNMMRILRLTGTLDLAVRLNAIVLTGGRFHLLGNDKNRGSYCDNFIKLVTLAEKNVGEIIKHIKVFIPNCYILHPATLEKLVSMISNSKRHELIPDLLGLVNWNNKRNVDIDAFPKILGILKSIDYESVDIESKFRLSDCLDKLLDQAKIRSVSVLKIEKNIALAVEVASRLTNGELLWRFIQFGYEHRLLMASIVHQNVVDYVTSSQFDRAIKLVEYLAKCLTRSAVAKEPEQRALAELCCYCQEVMLPLLVKSNVNVGDFNMHLAECEKFVVSSDSSSSSTSSDSESDSDSDGEKGGHK